MAKSTGPDLADNTHEDVALQLRAVLDAALAGSLTASHGMIQHLSGALDAVDWLGEPHRITRDEAGSDSVRTSISEEFFMS